MVDDLEILERAASWSDAGLGVALATVVSTWGSAPRPAGSQLAVNEKGEFVGSVSGGCVEGAVVREALLAIQDGKPRVLEYGVTHDRAWEVGLACGGTIQVLVEKLG
jgi:xanthine/CO dehydrogenase XdhC/CoxF family maturation factor